MSRPCLCIMGGNGSQFIVADGAVAVLAAGYWEADPRPWTMAPGKRLLRGARWRRWTGSSAAYDIVDEVDVL